MEAGLDSARERRAALAVLQQIEQTGVDPLDAMEALSTPVGYSRKPVDIVTFVEGREYLNLKGQIYPKLLDDLVELFEGEYYKAILTGAIGWGKSVLSELALLRMLYEISCLENPQRFFGLVENTTIWLVNVSVNMTSAKRVVFEGLKGKIKQSEYFSRIFRHDPHYTSELRFPKKIWLAPSTSTQSGVLGLAIFGAVLDEGNFLPVVQESKQAVPGESRVYDAAQVLKNAIERRMKSRFLHGGRLPGKLLLVSSAQYPDDFLEREIEASRGDPHVFIRRYSQWGAKPPETYGPERFRIFLAPGRQSRILAEGEDPPLGVDGQVFEAPKDYISDFKRDIYGSIRDLLGLPTEAIQPFFRQRERLYTAIDESRRHPFTALVTTLQDGAAIDREALCQLDPTTHQWRPRWHPEEGRVVHIDLGLTKDAAGLAMGCRGGTKTVLRRSAQGEQYLEHVPVIWYDLLLRVVPPPEGEINFGNIRGLLYELIGLGFRLDLVTLDSFESRDFIQQMEGRGIRSELLSVDASMEPYAQFQSALYEERVHYYRYEPLLEELINLEQKGDRVDHRPHGAKDCADAAAGVAWSLHLARPTVIPPMLGMMDTLAVAPDDPRDRCRVKGCGGIGSVYGYCRTHWDGLPPEEQDRAAERREDLIWTMAPTNE
jgi:hypothetical protein